MGFKYDKHNHRDPVAQKMAERGGFDMNATYVRTKDGKLVKEEHVIPKRKTQEAHVLVDADFTAVENNILRQLQPEAPKTLTFHASYPEFPTAPHVLSGDDVQCRKDYCGEWGLDFITLKPLTA